LPKMREGSAEIEVSPRRGLGGVPAHRSLPPGKPCGASQRMVPPSLRQTAKGRVTISLDLAPYAPRRADQPEAAGAFAVGGWGKERLSAKTRWRTRQG
jgi:hypothetical protein